MTGDNAIDPELDEISRTNVFVQHMISHKQPLTRATYIRLRYGDQVPEPWTATHENLLPPVFRRPDLELVHETLRRFGDTIGVTYTGEIPR